MSGTLLPKTDYGKVLREQKTMFWLMVQSSQHSLSAQYEVTLNFTMFDLDPLGYGDSCTDADGDFDYLEVYDVITGEVRFPANSVTLCCPRSHSTNNVWSKN